ncbi:MAG TPA: hypothetical protein DCM40_03170 [Maribacter sp.]|jgi:hypothetical protein|nr:hypothetical protein [Maribacter sp.]|tara:strand:+ start:240 stop:572 length:333 start_codon:yes stop_codon:yes gene_type:complete
MADVIKVVKGDELPIITLTLTDDVANTPLDLSNVNTTVSVKFRAVNTTTVLSTIACSKLNNGTDGKVTFNFTGGVLDVDEGMYEGEVSVVFPSGTQTVYDVLKFRVRSNF